MNQLSKRTRRVLFPQLPLLAVSAFPALCMANPLTFDAFAELGAVTDYGKISPGAGIAARHSSGFGVELSAQRLGSYKANSFANIPPLRNPIPVTLTSPHGDSIALMLTYRHTFSDGHWFGGIRAGAHRWSYDTTVVYAIDGPIVDRYSQSGTGFAAGAEVGRFISKRLSISLTAQHFASLGPDQQRAAIRLSYTF